MRQLLDEASKGDYGVGAFNVNNMEQIQAIMEAARQTRSPVIVQASRGARAYSNDRFLYHLMRAVIEVYPEIRTVLHRLAMTAAIRKVFAEHPEEFDPRSYLKPAREGMRKVIAQRMTEFGQAGHAGDYRPIPLSEMAKQYASEAVTV